mmetsp:Transcript_2076/g.3671  ORF Transcript_2076/g.3671 Transcript_2076/m.3671 type:complete len:146 (-) Transcript_2076:91-528(-)
MDVSTKNKDLHAFQAKVVDKMVRVHVKDGREYIGIFGCIDKSAALFIIDALEIIETKQESKNATIFHELFTPYIINVPSDPSCSKVFKYTGNLVIQKRDILKVTLDKKAQERFEEIKQLIRDGKFSSAQEEEQEKVDARRLEMVS